MCCIWLFLSNYISKLFYYVRCLKQMHRPDVYLKFGSIKKLVYEDYEAYL